MMGGLEPEGASVSVDTSVPHIARVYDYWLGGRYCASDLRAFTARP